MKNFNIFGVHLKIWFLWRGGGGRSWKTGIEGGIAREKTAWIVSRFNGCVWQEQEGGDCFWGVGWYLNDTIPISFCLWCCKISCLLYAHGYMLLCTHNGLHSRKAIVIEEVLWCFSLMVFYILGEVFHKNEVA